MLKTDNSAFWISVNTVRFDWSHDENCVSIEQGKNQLGNVEKERKLVSVNRRLESSGILVIEVFFFNFYGTKVKPLRPVEDYRAQLFKGPITLPNSKIVIH